MKANNQENILDKLKEFKFHGLISHWEEIRDAEWVNHLVEWEEQERSYRSLETRIKSAKIGKFKPMTEFDWNWPKKIDRETVEELLKLDFLKDLTNIIFCGPSGAGKSTIARNIAYGAVLRGNSVLFTTAGFMLNDLASQDGDNALRRRIKFYVQPTLLIVDELGYLSYSNRHADLLFEIVSRRYENKPTIVTTNKPFSEWGEMFPNVACVVSLIDRLVHNSEIISIDADSYRFKESREKSEGRREARSKKQKIKPNNKNQGV